MWSGCKSFPSSCVVFTLLSLSGSKPLTKITRWVFFFLNKWWRVWSYGVRHQSGTVEVWAGELGADGAHVGPADTVGGAEHPGDEGQLQQISFWFTFRPSRHCGHEFSTVIFSFSLVQYRTVGAAAQNEENEVEVAAAAAVLSPTVLSRFFSPLLQVEPSLM